MLRVIPQRTLPKGWLTRNYTTVFKHSNIAELVASVYFVPTLPEQVPLLHGLPEVRMNIASLRILIYETEY